MLHCFLSEELSPVQLVVDPLAVEELAVGATNQCMICIHSLAAVNHHSPLHTHNEHECGDRGCCKQAMVCLGKCEGCSSKQWSAALHEVCQKEGTWLAGTDFGQVAAWRVHICHCTPAHGEMSASVQVHVTVVYCIPGAKSYSGEAQNVPT